LLNADSCSPLKAETLKAYGVSGSKSDEHSRRFREPTPEKRLHKDSEGEKKIHSNY